MEYTKAGYHNKFDISRFEDEERMILNNLSKSWFLSYSGDKISLGTSSYNYILIKPLTKFSEMFNLEREIICVFSKYKNFEPRTLEVFEKIKNSLDNRYRTENICFMLISGDKDVNIKIDNILASEIEHPIVISYAYETIKTNSPKINYEESFRKKFYTRDLFSFHSPLKKDTYFFGRNNLVNEIVNKHRSFEHSSLFGLRKSGKTSIVYAVQRRLEIDNIRYYLLDCESPSIHKKRWFELLEKIIKDFCDLPEVKANIKYEHRYLEKNAAENFEKDMMKIYKELGKKHIVMIFDEIERISPQTSSSKHWKEDKDFIYFWQTLRGFSQKNLSILTFMIVGTNPSCIEKPELCDDDNPIYLSSEPQYVPSFTFEQVKEMVQKLSYFMGLVISDAICSKLYFDFGGHPFIIRQVCSKLNKNITNSRPFTIDKTLYEKTTKDFVSESSEYLDMIVLILKEWYPDEYDMLTYLANNDISTFNELAEMNTDYTKHLVGYELIQKNNGGYSFNFEILKIYIQNKNKYKKINLNNSEKRQEISKRRNNLEEVLRVLIKRTLHTSLGKKKAKEAVLKLIEENRRNKLNDITLDELLHKHSVHLFFLDLSTIINKQWVNFENLFEGHEKEYIITMLNYINKYGRPDAHAKKITTNEFNQLRLYFDTLEEIIEDFIN